MAQEPDPPLAGLRVLDLSMYIAGPFGSMLMADLGADVIKIEPLTGDPVRKNQRGPQIRGENAQFYCVNRNKRSVAIDLKSGAGRTLFLGMVERADIVWENFRPGVTERLQIDYDRLRTVNPRIIHCAISGYGATGPYRDWPAVDLIIQAMSGGMSITGEPGRPPARMGFAVADLAGGIFGLHGVLAALYSRERTGRGRSIDISLLDTQIAMLWEEVTHHFWTGGTPGPMGPGHPNIVPYQAFETADGSIVVAASLDRFWPLFCQVIGVAELADDPRFATNGARVEHRAQLIPLLARPLKTRTSRDWLERLRAAQVPAGPVNSVAEALRDPQVASREMVVAIDDPVAGAVHVAGNPIKMSGVASIDFKPAPLIGEHTREVLASLLGLSDAEIERLQETNVVRGAQRRS